MSFCWKLSFRSSFLVNNTLMSNQKLLQKAKKKIKSISIFLYQNWNVNFLIWKKKSFKDLHQCVFSSLHTSMNISAKHKWHLLQIRYLKGRPQKRVESFKNGHKFNDNCKQRFQTYKKVENKSRRTSNFALLFSAPILHAN